MSLVRTGIVLAAVVALLPSDKERQDELYAMVTALAGDALTYCDRNAETCAKAAAAWDEVKVKAKFAGALALDILERHGQLSGHDAVAGAARSPQTAEKRGTLTAADLAPAWRGAR